MSNIDDNQQTSISCGTTEICQASNVPSVNPTVTNVISTTTLLQPNQGT